MATANMRYNAGGRAGPEGAEAYLEVVLPPGDYTLVVGGETDVGPYEVSFRRLTD